MKGLLARQKSTDGVANVYNLFRDSFHGSESKVFIELEDGTTYNFAQLEEISARFKHLFENLAVKKGDRVLVRAYKSPEVIFAYAACLRMGAVFVPVDTSLKEAEIKTILSDCQPALIICAIEEGVIFDSLVDTRTTFVRTLSSSDTNGSLIEESEYLPPRTDILEVKPADIACMLYTSGTTGHPKAAMLTHANLIFNTVAMRRVWEFKSNDIVLHPLALFHIPGIIAINLAIVDTSRVLFLRSADPRTVLNLLSRATVFMAGPSTYIELLAHAELNRERCLRIRLFVEVAASLPISTFHEFKERTGKMIIERYGMTETMHITSNVIEHAVAGSCGLPIPGVELRITNDKGEPIPVGEVGNIEVRGPSVFKGYWGDEQKTREAFRPDGFFMTGDVGKLDKDGYLWIVGRTKDIIIVNGLNVYPKEIEQYIDAIDGVDESTVFGVPDPILGEHAVALVKKRIDSHITEKDVVEILRDKISLRKLPQRIHFVDQIPRNERGKVQKNLLRERYID